ncbi:hypothetical protein SLE2022_196550 [Rubroshorea leprosula]
MKVKSSPEKLSPLKIPSSLVEEDYGRAESNDSRGLQIVDPNSFPISKSFDLPDGWVVEERPRANCPSNPGRVDKFYRELESGRRFRSLPAVQRYLSGGEPENTVRHKPVNRTFCSHDYENSMQIVPPRYTSSGESFNLPDGWIVEHVPRSNAKYAGIVDKFYIEPVTGYRFRSLRSVERYLAEVGASTPSKNSGSQKKNISDEDHSWDMVLKCLADSKSTKTNYESKQLKTSGSRKKQKSGNEVNHAMLNFASPPAKVKWVLGGPGRNLWNSFMGESGVPENVQKTWFKTFILSIEERNIQQPENSWESS